MSTASVIIIGNEILSGRTRDTNLSWLATELNALGIRLREARVIPDIPAAIITTVNAMRATYDYVFTTGGIGPTHDDITSQCIAQAFGVKYTLHPAAHALLLGHYGMEKLNEARLRMCTMPEGAMLIPNAISIAPGFSMENVYVMAGIPRVMQSMFGEIRHTLKGGAPMLSETVSAFVAEGTIARALSDLQSAYQDVEIGSYPFERAGRYGTSLVARHENQARLAQVRAKLLKLVSEAGGELTEE